MLSHNILKDFEHWLYELYRHIGGKTSSWDEHHSMVYVLIYIYTACFNYSPFFCIDDAHMSLYHGSISSEWAFLQGGIIISKCHSCLKGNIVKALQCQKIVLIAMICFLRSRTIVSLLWIYWYISFLLYYL